MCTKTISVREHCPDQMGPLNYVTWEAKMWCVSQWLCCFCSTSVVVQKHTGFLTCLQSNWTERLLVKEPQRASSCISPLSVCSNTNLLTCVCVVFTAVLCFCLFAVPWVRGGEVGMRIEAVWRTQWELSGQRLPLSIVPDYWNAVLYWDANETVYACVCMCVCVCVSLLVTSTSLTNTQIRSALC